MSTEQKFPDYGDVMRMNTYSHRCDGIDVVKMARFATLYHALATEVGEDVLIDAWEKFRAGQVW